MLLDFKSKSTQGEAPTDAPIRRHHHRSRPGRSRPSQPSHRSRPNRSLRRTTPLRRHLRQHRLHPHQDHDRQRLRRPHRPPRRGVWGLHRHQHRSRYKSRQRTPRDHRLEVPHRSRKIPPRQPKHHRLHRHRNLRIAQHRARPQRNSSGQPYLHQRRRTSKNPPVPPHLKHTHSPPQHRARQQRNSSGQPYLHQRRQTSKNPPVPRHLNHTLSHQQQPTCSEHAASTSSGRRRQLHRDRIRPNVPPVRKQGHHR